MSETSESLFELVRSLLWCNRTGPREFIADHYCSEIAVRLFRSSIEELKSKWSQNGLGMLQDSFVLAHTAIAAKQINLVNFPIGFERRWHDATRTKTD